MKVFLQVYSWVLGSFLIVAMTMRSPHGSVLMEQNVPLEPQTSFPSSVGIRTGEMNVESGDGQPKVVWLMSFPNSGTSFTLHRIREASNTTTATNYGDESEIKDEPSVPVVNSSQSGPFLQLYKNRAFTNLPRNILTKTHCGGYCSDCRVQDYIETTRTFQIACQSGNRILRNSTVPEQVTYHQHLVHKAIHLIRHPLDNIVARFHLIYKRAHGDKNTYFTTRYPNNSTGFKKWCLDEDSRSKLIRDKEYKWMDRWVDDALKERLKSVPCHQEFFRYIQWHNLAFTVCRDLNLFSLVIHYRDYSRDLETTTNRILQFLELPRVASGEPFSDGKEYREYYSLEQRSAVWRLLEEMASAETLNSLKDYDFS